MASFSFLPTIQTTNQTQTSAPSWAPQVGALTQAFSGAQDAFNQQRATGPYQGDYLATPNDLQYGAINQAAGFAQGPASGVGSSQIDQGRGLLGNYGLAGNAASGLYSLGNADNTQGALNTGAAYANNPWIDDAVKAATSSAYSQAAENDIPNLYRNAAASGNLNSDRAAIAQGIVERGLAKNAQNISSTMRSNAFNQGTQDYFTGRGQSMGALGSSGSLGASLGGAGSSMMSQGINDQANLSSLYSGAGDSLNTLNQSFLNNSLAKYQGRIADTWSPIQNLYSIAGANNWGSTQNTQGTTVSMGPVQNQQTTPGLAGYLGAGMGAAGTLAGMALGGPAGGTVGGALARYLSPSVFGGK